LAGINPDARIGALIKHASKHLIGGRSFAVVSSYHISHRSEQGRLSDAEDYVGLVLYAKDGRTEWSLGGVKCKAGYIYYRKTRDIQHIDSNHGQVRLAVSWCDWPSAGKMVGAGQTPRSSATRGAGALSSGTSAAQQVTLRTCTNLDASLSCVQARSVPAAPPRSNDDCWAMRCTGSEPAASYLPLAFV
jgi:hypothetical protein